MGEILLSVGILALGVVSSCVYKRWGKQNFLRFSLVSALLIGLMPGFGLLGPVFFDSLSLWIKFLVGVLCGASGAACLFLPIYITSTWAESARSHVRTMRVLGIGVGSMLANVVVIVIHFGLTFQGF